MNGIRVFILVLFLSVCYAETVPLVRGRVETEAVFVGNDLLVELRAADGRLDSLYQSSVANSGTFEFRDVKGGTYTLRLTTMRGDVVSEQLVDLFPFSGELCIRLPKRSAARPGSGTVSIRELQHPVQPKAFRALVDAQRATESGNADEAVRKLEQALRIDPSYAAARCNLGVEYIRRGRYPEAADQFEKALAGGAGDAMIYANLCYAYYALGRWKESEQAARRALDLDNHYARAHYLLGAVLARTIRPEALENAPEAARHLRLGADEIPRAHLDIAKIYVAEGDRLGAAEEVRLYLKTGDKNYRTVAQNMLAMILGKQEGQP